jgi:hypothetical protein
VIKDEQEAKRMADSAEKQQADNAKKVMEQMENEQKEGDKTDESAS